MTRDREPRGPSTPDRLDPRRCWHYELATPPQDPAVPTVWIDLDHRPPQLVDRRGNPLTHPRPFGFQRARGVSLERPNQP